MRKYDEKSMKLLAVCCNQCKKELRVENGYLKEGCFGVDVTFGYFSHKDGIRQKFDLCEECYDKMVKQFAIPVEECENNELL